MTYVDPKASATAGAAHSDLLTQLLPLAPAVLGFLAGDYGELKRDLRTWAKKDPIDALMAVVVGGGIAFYAAERATNPNCTTPWDGILYMSTALSVGYDNLFPTTPAGHAIATFAQTFGPALANAALEPPADEIAAAAEADARVSAAHQVALLERLDKIIELLEAKS